MSTYQETAEEVQAAIDNPPVNDSAVILAELVDAEKRRERLQAELEAAEEKVKALSSALLVHWTDQGVQRATQGGRTVYVREDFYCSKRGGVGMDDVLEAMKQNGLGHLISMGYNAQSLKGRVKELWDGDNVPDSLKQVLNLGVKRRLCVVKA